MHPPLRACMKRRATRRFGKDLPSFRGTRYDHFEQPRGPRLESIQVMAFCPHCGKQVTEQASKCIACGKEIEPKAKGARFKGTMMMTPAEKGSPAAPSAGNIPEQAKPLETAAPAAQPPPAAAAPRAPAPASSKVMKATMLGTGGAGLAPPPGARPVAAASAATAPRPAAAASAGSAAAVPPAAGSSGWNQSPKPAARPLSNLGSPKLDAPSPPAEVAKAYEPSSREDSQRFAVSSSAEHGSYGEPRARESTEGVVPVLPTGKLLAVGVGGVLVISAVGYLAARLLGLLN